jgi:hypothetical protein
MSQAGESRMGKADQSSFGSPFMNSIDELLSNKHYWKASLSPKVSTDLLTTA